MSLGPVMLDVEGVALTPADRDLLREPAVGGVILFTRNYESPDQIADLVSEIRALRSPALLVAVDYEGGRVQRFRDGFTQIPSMRRIGREYDRDSESGLGAAREAGCTHMIVPSGNAMARFWKESVRSRVLIAGC